MTGWTDLPADLSDEVRLTRLSDYLPKAPVVSSDLQRAVTTADAIERSRPRLPNDPDLRELNFGDWETRRFGDIKDEPLIRAFYETPGDVSAPGGECWNELCDRVNAAVERVSRNGPDVILVAHMGTILTQVQRALGLSAYDTFARKIDNLSVTCLSWDGVWRLEVLNHRP